MREPERVQARVVLSRRGGIGRRARFRSVFREECGFDSHRRYHFFEKSGCQSLKDFWNLLRVWHNGCAPAFQAGYTGSTPVTRSICQNLTIHIKYGWIPERSKGADCKSASDAFGGSNPPPATIFDFITATIVAVFFMLKQYNKILAAEFFRRQYRR